MVASKKYFIMALFTGLTSLLPGYASAQQKGSKDIGGGEEEISVVKPYHPTLSDAVKLSVFPEKDTAATVLPKLSYTIASRKITTAIEVTPIKPMRIKDETISKLYKNFVKLGFGNYTTPYGELFISSLRSKEYQVGTHLRHLSSSGQIPGVGYPGFSQNSAEIYGKRLVKTEWLEGSLEYSRDVVHRYGFNTSDTTINRDQIKQRYNYVGASFRLSGNLTDSSKVRHEAGISYYNYGDLYAANEDKLILFGDVAKRFSFGDMRVNTKIDYSNNKQMPGSSLDRTYIYICPMISKRVDKWKLTAGLNTVTTAGAESGFHLYPQAAAEVNIVENILDAYSSFSGNLEKNTFRSFSQENPFLSSSLSYTPSNVKIDFTAGLKGTLSAYTDFRASVGYREVENMPLFVPDTTLRPMNSFALVYDNVKVLNLHGELGHQYSEKWRFLLKADYNSYSLSKEQYAWYKPAFVTTVSTTYNIGNKIYLKADVFASSSRYSKTYQPNAARKLDGFVDASLGLDYRYSRIFSLFFNFNNIAAVRYYRWDNYPSQRFNLLAGLSYSF